MILAGVFDRIPKLKMMLAHSGGTLLFLAGRLDSCLQHDHKISKRLNKKPSEYLQNLYYDALCYSPHSLKMAVEMIGKERFMFGTDHPFFPNLDGSDVWESVESNKRAVNDVMGDHSSLILSQNAFRILGIQH